MRKICWIVWVGAGCAADPVTSTVCTDVQLDQSVLVLESDWQQASALGVLETNGCFSETADLALGNDPIFMNSGERVIVANRTQGVLYEIASNDLFFVQTFQVPDVDGESSNPWDAAFDSQGQLWVAQYGVSSVGVLDENGDYVSSVNLSSFADSDGNPEMSSIAIRGDTAFVALELLQVVGQQKLATGPGKMVSINTSTLEIISDWSLYGSNPFGPLVKTGSDENLVSVVVPGSFDSIDESDGIELVNLEKQTSTLLISEEMLQGSASEAIVVDDLHAYAIVAGTEPGVNPTWVVEIDPSIPAVTRTLLDSRDAEAGYYYVGLSIVGDTLLIADRTPSDPSIHLLDRETCEETGRIRTQLLPPIALRNRISQ